MAQNPSFVFPGNDIKWGQVITGDVTGTIPNGTVVSSLSGISVASGNILGNSTASTGVATSVTLSSIIDRALGSVEGDTLQRGPANWQILAPGTTVQFLKSGGPGALNFWSQPAITGCRDYFRGPWTPADASGAGLVFTGISAEYIEVGDLIWVSVQLTYPATANGSPAAIGGLPVNSANQNYAKSFSLILGGSVNCAAFLSANSPTLSVLNLNGSASITNAQLSGDTIVFNIWYTTA